PFGPGPPCAPSILVHVSNNRAGRRSWGPWIAAGVLVVLLAGLDQGGVLIALALIAGALGLALLFFRSSRGRGAGMIATALIALIIGGAPLDPGQPVDPAASAGAANTPAPTSSGASAEAPETPEASETPETQAPSTPP